MNSITNHTFRSTQLLDVVNEAISFFNKTPIVHLPPQRRFFGSGVYALYYTGNFELYSPLATANRNNCIWPIYVGKAVPPGWRTGRITKSSGTTLYSRLREHHHSILQVENLSPIDFRCRFMILVNIESDLINTVEAALIRKYKPIWNTTVDGFGNHDPGKGRYNQAPSEWDILHPGRAWVKKLTGERPKIDDIYDKTIKHLQLFFSSTTTDS